MGQKLGAYLILATFGCWIAALILFSIQPLELGLLQLKDGDEAWIANFTIGMPLASDPFYLGYGLPYWLLLRAVSVLSLRGSEFDWVGIIMMRIVSIIPTAIVCWWILRDRSVDHVSLYFRAAIILLFIVLSPSMLYNSTRMHPETIVFASCFFTLILLARADHLRSEKLIGAAAVYAAGISFKLSVAPIGIGFVVWAAMAGLQAYWLARQQMVASAAAWVTMKSLVRASLLAIATGVAVVSVMNAPAVVMGGVRKYSAWIAQAMASDASGHGWGAMVDPARWLDTYIDYVGPAVVLLLVPPGIIWASWIVFRPACVALTERRDKAAVLLCLLTAVVQFAYLTSASLKAGWWNHYLMPAHAALFAAAVFAATAAWRPVDATHATLHGMPLK